MQQQQPPQFLQQVNLQKVNVHEMMEKFQSKKEVYNFLIQECEAFLPKKDTINVFFLKQIVRGQKEYIKRSAVMVSAVPQIEGLAIEDFLNYVRESQELLRYIPDERDWQHLDKKWVCDVLYTKDTEGVQTMIKRAMEKRNKRLEKSQDLLIEMRPEFAAALKKCSTFSTEKGKSTYLLKPFSHTKRKKEEMKEVQEEEKQLERDKHGFLKVVKKLKRDNQDMQREIDELKDIELKMHSLQSQGYIDERGNPTVKH